MFGFNKFMAFLVVSAVVFGLAACGISVPQGQETKFLFDLKTSEVLGDVAGFMTYNEGGKYIHMHPGATTATMATFKLQGADGKINGLVISPYILPLEGDCKIFPDAGIVDVDLLADDKVVDHFRVDRDYKGDKNIDLKSASTLTVKVSNGNNTPVCDWFAFAVKSVK